jgi:3-dehydrosphinganine reductase
LSLAILLAKRGADVSIVARTQSKLDEALKALEVSTSTILDYVYDTNTFWQATRVLPQQKFHVYSFTLGTAADSDKALQTVCEPYGGRAPDAIFACAGSAKPKFLIDLTEQDISEGMVNAYWLQAWTAFVRL